MSDNGRFALITHRGQANIIRAGLLRDDLFMCVHEQFMTDAARLADIVLPATTFLEHDDMYRAGGAVFHDSAVWVKRAA